MRAFLCSLLAVVIVAIAGAYTLNIFQQTAAQALTTGSARLDHQEAVNRIGRKG